MLGEAIHEQEWFWTVRITATFCKRYGWYLEVETPDNKAFNRIGPFNTEFAAWLWYAEHRATV